MCGTRLPRRARAETYAEYLILYIDGYQKVKIVNGGGVFVMITDRCCLIVIFCTAKLCTVCTAKLILYTKGVKVRQDIIVFST